MKRYLIFLTFASILSTVFRRIVTAGILASSSDLFGPFTCVITPTLHFIIVAVITILHRRHIITKVFISAS